MGVLLIDWLIFFVLFELFASIIPLMGLSFGLCTRSRSSQKAEIDLNLIWFDFFFFSVVVWSITSHRLVLILMMASKSKQDAILIGMEWMMAMECVRNLERFAASGILPLTFFAWYTVCMCEFTSNPFSSSFNPSSFKFFRVIFHFMQLNIWAGIGGRVTSKYSFSPFPWLVAWNQWKGCRRSNKWI